jgi:hypothetical protein
MPPKKPLHVDPAELRAQAGGLNTVGDTLQANLAKAINALEGLGNFWGDDQYGHMFHDGANGRPGYGAQHDTVSTDTNAIISGYHEIAGLPTRHHGAGGLSEMANNVDVANWNSLAALPQIPK